jgi:hypothetical protein
LQYHFQPFHPYTLVLSLFGLPSWKLAWRRYS